MSRKIIKLILLISGILIFAAGAVIFITSLVGMKSQNPDDSNYLVRIVFTFNAIAVISIIPLSIAAIMHSKDKRETKKSLSGFLKGLASYWIVFGIVIIVAIIILSIFVFK
jgi:cytochrome bd-type quinol oxidase subunit 2